SAEIGSDVPFFFGAPAAWCTGRGEIVTPLRLGQTLDLVLICPPEALSTAAVYAALTVPDKPLDGTRVREAATAGDVEKLGHNLHNRLQEPAQRLCPAVTSALAALARMVPAGTLMSGSGSTVFALCRSPEEAWQVARAYRPVRQDTDGTRVFVVSSCD